MGERCPLANALPSQSHRPSPEWLCLRRDGCVSAEAAVSQKRRLSKGELSLEKNGSRGESVFFIRTFERCVIMAVTM